MSIKKRSIFLVSAFFVLAGIPFLWLSGYLATPSMFFFTKVNAFDLANVGQRYVIYSKVSYPKNHPIDPSGVVQIDRVDRETGSRIYSFLFYLEEVDDVKSLKIRVDARGVPRLEVGPGWTEGVDGLALAGSVE